MISLSGNLTGINDSVTARLDGKFSRTGYDTITVHYFSDNKISITYPADNIDTNEEVIVLKGTTYSSAAGDTISVYLNGNLIGDTVISSLNENFSSTVALSGLNDSLWVVLKSANSDTDADTYYLTVNYYDTPNIEITYPPDDHDTLTSVITVRGTTAGSYISDSVIIYSNAVANTTFILTSDSGQWSGTVSINSANQNITVELKDRFGRSVYDTITADYFESPEISVTLPSNNSDTKENTIIISGTSTESGAGGTFQGNETNAGSTSSWVGSVATINVSIVTAATIYVAYTISAAPMTVQYVD